MEKSVKEKTQINKMPAARKSKTEILSEREVDRLEWLIDAIEAAGVSEFIEYIRSPAKMFWPNFLAWVFRWLWALLGVALVLTTIGWAFAITLDLPLIGKRLEPYITRAQTEMNRYLDQTNYSDEFRSLDTTLRGLDATMKSVEANTKPRN
jgi:Domain of unknown function (DUF5665)